MNFEELQMKRESCRVYADRPVTREQLVHLVDVARFAPSACNSQPWHFILVDEPESREKVVEAFDDNGLTGCPWGPSISREWRSITAPSILPRWISGWRPWGSAMKLLPWGWERASSAP